MHADKQTHPVIQSVGDPRFQQLKRLQTAQGRAQSGLFLIEGIRHVARAVEEKAPIQSLFLSPADLSNPFGQKLARRLRQSGVPTVTLAGPLYRQLTLAAEPQGLGAVVRQQWKSLQDVRPLPGSMWLAVESIDAPGNLGTIIRTAEATGAEGIIVIGNSAADPYEPAAIRASMGSLFALQLIRASSIRDFANWTRHRNVALVGSSPSGLLDYRAFRCRWPAALVIGSEKQGLSSEMMEACDFVVRLPMRGRGDSINAAVAAGVLLYELFDQRGRQLPTPSRIPSLPGTPRMDP